MATLVKLLAETKGAGPLAQDFLFFSCAARVYIIKLVLLDGIEQPPNDRNSVKARRRCGKPKRERCVKAEVAVCFVAVGLVEPGRLEDEVISRTFAHRQPQAELRCAREKMLLHFPSGLLVAPEEE